jgi:uncharacterized membrane protein YccC
MTRIRPLWMRLPSNEINGIAVGLGVALVHVGLLPFVSQAAVMMATSGAIYAGFPHVVDRASRSARRSLAGGVVGAISTAMVSLLGPHPLVLQGAMGLVVFVAMMALAWGPRALPISFVAVLALVLSLVTGPSLSPWQATGWTLLGGTTYAGWAFISTIPFTQRYKTLALVNVLRASEQLLRSRASVLEQHYEGEDVSAMRWLQIDEEARLATLIQTARELVFAGSNAPGALHAQLLFTAMELRDLVFTSRLDLDLLGEDRVARQIRGRLARSLRANASALARVATALQLRQRQGLELPQDPNHIAAILDDRSLPPEEPRLRLLPAIASRQRQLLDLVTSMHELLLGHHTAVPTTSLDRERLIAKESWPLREVWRQLSPDSPVFRHAARSALAVMAAHAFAHALPWATHPHWIVLSVVVVLRGNFAQTLSRRNDRILGTVIGCVLTAVLVNVASEWILALTLFVANGVAHAYVNVRYALTAMAATLMALLQSHFFDPITSLVVLERLADTVIGASFAWAFSFVLPSWSRRALPGLVKRTLTALRAYADSALELGSDAADRQQLNREQAYDALDLLISTVRLGSVEPLRVRPPTRLFLSFIDHTQALMAHLSSLRLILVRRSAQLEGDATAEALSKARRRLGACLGHESAAPPSEPNFTLMGLEPPSVPAERAAFPWLMRRITITVTEAGRTADAATVALNALHGGEQVPLERNTNVPLA